jgi:hypothetical protein
MESVESQLPLKLGVLEIVALGRVEYKRKEFHNERTVFPIGFKSERSYASYLYPKERTIYTCEILDAEEYSGNDALFRVTPADDPDNACTSNSASGAWLPIIKRVGEATKKGKRNTYTVSGVHFFGLSLPKVVALIDQLPNISKCTYYKAVKGSPTKAEKPKPTPPRRHRKPQVFEPDETSPTRKRKERPNCFKCTKNDSQKNMLTCSKCAIHMHTFCHNPSLDTIPEHLRDGWRCDDCKYCCLCSRDDADESLLLCEICDRGFHTFCCSLDQIPEGTWLCEDCNAEILPDKTEPKRRKVVVEPRQEDVKPEIVPPVVPVEDVQIEEEEDSPVDEQAVLEYLLPDFFSSVGRTVIDLPAFGFFSE